MEKECLFKMQFISIPHKQEGIFSLALLPPSQAGRTRCFLLEQLTRGECFQIYQALVHFEKRFLYSTYFLLWPFYLGISLKIQALYLGQKGCEPGALHLSRCSVILKGKYEETKGKKKHTASSWLGTLMILWEAAVDWRNGKKLHHLPKLNRYFSPQEK